MQLNIQGKQMDLGDALREHMSERLETINSKYFGRATSGEVTLAPEGNSSFKTHIIIHVNKNIQVVGSATEHDPYVSFDQAAERVAKQLRRYKRRLRDNHEAAEDSPEAELLKARNYVIAANEDDPAEDEEDDGVPHGEDPAVIAEIDSHIETLSVSDAVMRLDLSGQTALMFRNAGNGRLNMLHRRPDGHIGWVDPTE